MFAEIPDERPPRRAHGEVATNENPPGASGPPPAPSGPPSDNPSLSTRFPGSSNPPERLFAGRYRIIKELGRGGMGVVSQAEDTRLPRVVAIKVPIRLDDPESHRRFLKEAEAAAKLDHPNICRILDLGEADGLPYIVFAFVQGKTLAEVVNRQPLDPILAAKITRRIARTLQFAHKLGISHRDLKPVNLMIGPHRELIVMDFGLARLESDVRRTRTGQVFGTLPYMAPEQVQGRSVDMGKSCDIYTLGVIFYELLTGRLPFLGAAWELPRQIVYLDPEPPSKTRPLLDPVWDAIVLKAMSKRIADRFGSMEELGRAIEAQIPRGRPGPPDGTPPRIDPDGSYAGPAQAVRPRDADVASLPVHVRPEPLRPRDDRPAKHEGVAWIAIGLMTMLGLDVSLATYRRAPQLDASVPQPASRPAGESPPSSGQARPPLRLEAPKRGPSSPTRPPVARSTN
jgi:serine/threonine protein kinase